MIHHLSHEYNIYTIILYCNIIIQHPQWGSSVYPASLFTTATEEAALSVMLAMMGERERRAEEGLLVRQTGGRREEVEVEEVTSS